MPFTSQKMLAFLKDKGISTKCWFFRKPGLGGLEKRKETVDLGSWKPADKQESKNVPELEPAHFLNWPCISEGPGRVSPSLLKILETSLSNGTFCNDGNVLYQCCPMGTCGY